MSMDIERVNVRPGSRGWNSTTLAGAASERQYKASMRRIDNHYSMENPDSHQ
jgi:hypothetical protein